MGSLNDFNYPQHSARSAGWHGGRGGGRPGRRLLRQCVLAAAGFCAVAFLVGQEGWWGQGARYVAGPGLAAESSWLPVGAAAEAETEAEPFAAELAVESETVEAETAEADAAASEMAETAESAIPQFTAPASGVVVSELTGDEAAGGILIQGSANQNVRATAAGTVSGVSFADGGYRLELEHAAGFHSVYEGLSQLAVEVGDQVSLGQSIGVAAAGELNFTLLQNGAALDPLEYLFQ